MVVGAPTVHEAAQRGDGPKPLHENETLFRCPNGTTLLLAKELVAKHGEKNESAKHANAQTKVCETGHAFVKAVDAVEDGRERGKEEEDDTKHKTCVEGDEQNNGRKDEQLEGANDGAQQQLLGSEVGNAGGHKI